MTTPRTRRRAPTTGRHGPGPRGRENRARPWHPHAASWPRRTPRIHASVLIITAHFGCRTNWCRPCPGYLRLVRRRQPALTMLPCAGRHDVERPRSRCVPPGRRCRRARVPSSAPWTPLDRRGHCLPRHLPRGQSGNPCAATNPIDAPSPPGCRHLMDGIKAEMCLLRAPAPRSRRGHRHLRHERPRFTRRIRDIVAGEQRPSRSPSNPSIRHGLPLDADHVDALPEEPLLG